MNKLVRVFASAALLVSVITLITRLVGFLRWLVFSPAVGATAVGNAYQSANQVPNILFEVVAGGALAGAVIPLLAIPLARSDKETAGRIASALLTWAVSVTLPLSIILAVFAHPIADLLVTSSTKTNQTGLEATAALLLMFAPQLVLYGIGAVLTGVLQAHRKFLWPAFTPLLSSLVVIGCYIAYSSVGGNDHTWQTHIGWLGWGTTAGVAALALPLALPVRSTGLSIRPTWSFPPGVAHRALRLAGAGMAALLAQQAAVLVTLKLSNYSGGDGTLVIFSYINAVYLLPYAVLAVPVATVMFPSLSGWVGQTKDTEASSAEREAAGVRLRQLTSTTTAVIISIGMLGAVILLSAAEPLQTFFLAIDAARGRPGVPFSSMGQAIMIMAIAVPGWSFVAWGTRVFYAMERSRHSAVATTTGWIFVIVAMVLAIVVTNAFGDAGLTLVSICIGYAVGMSVAGVFLLISMRRVLGSTGLHGVLRRGLLSLVAAVVASAVGVLVSHWLAGPLGTGIVSSMLNGVVSALIGCAVFAGFLVLDRDYLGEIRGVLAGRRGAADQSGPASSSNPSEAHPAKATHPSMFENPGKKHRDPGESAEDSQQNRSQQGRSGRNRSPQSEDET